MDLLRQVEAFIRTEELLQQGEPVVLGVSGGIDSVVLLDVLHRLGYAPHVVHVNYGIRPGASADEEFVQALADSRRLSISVVQAPLDPDAPGSIQDAARLARYRAFEETAVNQNARTVAVAHHADDQAETVLMHLFRGTGIDGLAGMAASRSIRKSSDVNLVRPLLTATRKQISNYALDNRIEWREDETNASVEFSRNLVRNRLIPVAEEAFGPGVRSRVSTTAGLVRQFLDAGAETEESVFTSCTDAVDKAILLAPFADLSIAWRGRVIALALRKWTHLTHVDGRVIEAVRGLAQSQTGRNYAKAGITVVRDRDRLLFNASPENSPTILPALLDLGQAVTVAGRSVALLKLGAKPSDELLRSLPASVELVDLDRLQLPARIRPWQAGDRFVPLGMAGEKLVSDFLTDLKVAVMSRKLELVLECDDKVMGVIGRRMSEAIKISERTTNAAVLVTTSS